MFIVHCTLNNSGVGGIQRPVNQFQVENFQISSFKGLTLLAPSSKLESFKFILPKSAILFSHCIHSVAFLATASPTSVETKERLLL
jgi:hypothetical protein